MTALHNATHFNQVFSATKDKGYCCQFNIMCSYLWWFHRDEYSWHIMETQPHWSGVSPPGQVGSLEEAGITHKMLYPKPSVAIHLDYHPKAFRNKKQNVNFLLRQGYCTYLYTQINQTSYLMLPECKSVNVKGYNPNQFMFENLDWRYHTKHREAFQRCEDRFRRSNSCHAFDSKVINSWKEHIRIAW